ncbi:MAG: diguanylate cyclase [Alphaproteobacteria bacterium]|uniref:diguanylate cyclase n=1 Tax=Candidatus Nitrobium versatile TaxID=2884831 RepID=A0A953M0V5_9BACT|nr:diguanylate cyclase [Candidatus Nitrobium versatile]
MKTVVTITRDLVLTSVVERLLSDSYRILLFSSLQASLDYIYNSLPDVLVVEIGAEDTQTVSLLNGLKADPSFGHLPVLAVISDCCTLPGGDFLIVDDFVRHTCLETDLRTRIELCISRAERVVEVNPLTRLPGNITISKQLQKRLDAGEIFGLAYADLDHFKPYNDRYGFSRGDEVLKMLGRLILNSVKEKQPLGSFVGHIGGDDFIYIMDYSDIEAVSHIIGSNFDRIIPTFYDAEDRARGYIESVDREGEARTFPLISLSIGITHNKFRKFTHYGEMAEVASEMKKYAKSIKGSCCKMDRRRYDRTGEVCP